MRVERMKDDEDEKEKMEKTRQGLPPFSFSLLL